MFVSSKNTSIWFFQVVFGIGGDQTILNLHEDGVDIESYAHHDYSTKCHSGEEIAHVGVSETVESTYFWE